MVLLGAPSLIACNGSFRGSVGDYLTHFSIFVIKLALNVELIDVILAFKITVVNS